MSAAPTDFIPLAVITQAHGVRGEVKIQSFTEPAEGFFSYPLSDEKGNSYSLTRSGVQKHLFLCRIAGVTDRNQAELLKGREIGTARANLPPPEEGHTYARDLIGCTVSDENGVHIGIVRALANYGASDIVVIDTNDGELMLPYTHAFFPEVDTVNKQLVCSMPDVVDEEKA